MLAINVNKTLMKAKSLLKKGELDAAAGLFAAVLDEYPQNRQAAKGLASIERKRSPVTAGDMQLLQHELQNLVSLFNADKLPQALEVGQRLVSEYPDQPLIHNVLGAVCARLRDYESAIAHYTNAVQLKPDYAEAYNNLGAAFNDIGRHEDAIASYRSAIKFEPKFFEAYNNLGNALTDSDRVDEAISSYSAAIKIKPDYAMAAGKRLFQLAQACDWDVSQSTAASISDLGLSVEKVFPFDFLSLEDNPDRHRRRSELYARKTYQNQVLANIKCPDTKPARLRIGYFSADFHDHATMYLMAKLFEQHDRKNFKIFAYSYGRSHSDGMRSRATQAVDEFYDVNHRVDSEIAELCRGHKIDIAVDLKGYTQNTRLEIFSHRLAPVQISYLGYPGTTGAPFIDYLIADERVIPAEHSNCYSETVIYLPHSYQVNDDSRVISDSVMTRADAGLPEDGFVFCCFNNNYKIKSAEFDIWMRLLQQIEGSVLWLFRSNALAEENLRKQAQKRGVSPERLVFAERLQHSEHLARHCLADVFLDTFNFNAHTTASDALWAGLPVITKLGEGFAARVAGSLLFAIGLEELIATSESEYEQLALDLSLNAGKLAAVRAKLAANRLTTPLFDTALFTKHIEDAYQQAYQNYFDGQEPRSISVQP